MALKGTAHMVYFWRSDSDIRLPKTPGIFGGVARFKSH